MEDALKFQYSFRHDHKFFIIFIVFVFAGLLIANEKLGLGSTARQG